VQGDRRWRGGGARPARPRGAAPPQQTAAAAAPEHIPITKIFDQKSFIQALGTEPEEKLLQRIKTLLILAVTGGKILKIMVLFLTVYLDENF
jgi:hypothetical protein